MQKNILGFNSAYGLYGNSSSYRITMWFAYLEATL